jgi:hypothetical protein
MYFNLYSSMILLILFYIQDQKLVFLLPQVMYNSITVLRSLKIQPQVKPVAFKYTIICMGLLGLFCNVINLGSTYIFTDFAKAQLQKFLRVFVPLKHNYETSCINFVKEMCLYVFQKQIILLPSMYYSEICKCIVFNVFRQQVKYKVALCLRKSQ